jgi:hypothetical protein
MVRKDFPTRLIRDSLHALWTAGRREQAIQSLVRSPFIQPLLKTVRRSLGWQPLVEALYGEAFAAVCVRGALAAGPQRARGAVVVFGDAM